MLSIASLPPNANADTRHGDYRIKIIHLSYYQSFEYFLFFSIFAIFCYSVHFEISFSFVPLHPEVTKRVYFIGNERMLIAHDSNRLRFS